MRNKGDIFVAKSKSGTNISQFASKGVRKKLITYGKTFAGVVITVDKIVDLVEKIEKIAKYFKFFQ